MNEQFMQKMSLTGKNIVITGGHSGLGLATACCVAQAGGFPILLDIAPEEKLQEALDTIGTGAAYYFDITDTAGAAAITARVLEQHGHIDGLINNAGVHCKKPFEQTTIEDFRRVFDVHILGAVALTQAVTPAMKAQGGGSILFISSMSAMFGLTEVSAYAAAKSAVLGLTKTLTGELSADGIRVNAIAPGFIDTPMFHKAVDTDLPRQQKILGHTPMKRYGSPEDIGWAAVYYCSDAASFVTGTLLPVDGGCAIGF